MISMGNLKFQAASCSEGRIRELAQVKVSHWEHGLLAPKQFILEHRNELGHLLNA